MRIMIIVLSSFAAMVIIAHAAVPLRLTSLIGNGEQSPEVMSCLTLFTVWTVATALVFPTPMLAIWGFTLAAFIELYVGIVMELRVLIVWGIVACGLGLLTILARSEKQLVDQRDMQREQQDIAVYLAMRSLHETVPELLTRVSASPHPVAIAERPLARHVGMEPVTWRRKLALDPERSRT